LAGVAVGGSAPEADMKEFGHLEGVNVFDITSM
jgi:hypothetical protein